jgi:hypothetical protein
VTASALLKLTKAELRALRLPWHAPGLGEVHDRDHFCIGDKMSDRRARLIVSAMNKLTGRKTPKEKR